jgi:hypothetical protein
MTAFPGFVMQFYRVRAGDVNSPDIEWDKADFSLLSRTLLERFNEKT